MESIILPAPKADEKLTPFEKRIIAQETGIQSQRVLAALGFLANDLKDSDEDDVVGRLNAIDDLDAFDMADLEVAMIRIALRRGGIEDTEANQERVVLEDPADPTPAAD